MTESDVDTSRVSVRTYVPAYQRAEWDDHADELGMSRSEFVRTMVQAGRRGFVRTESGESGSGASDPVTANEESGAAPSPDANSRGTDLETRVVDALESADYLSWEELLEALTDDIEASLEEVLQELQSDGRVTYSGRNGGYTVDE